MIVSDIKLNDKVKAILNNRSKVLFCEGTMNASKSFALGINFMFRILESPADAKIFVIAGKSNSWLERYISDAASFISLFPKVARYKGGSNARIELKTKTGIKNIFLCGYTNKSTFTNILGLNIRGLLIEEVNGADMEFTKQAFGRISRFEDAFLLANSNGCSPDHEMFEYFNQCIPHPEFTEHIPASTLKDITEHDIKRDDYCYIFSSFYDNPVVDQTTIDEMLKVHRPGTHSHSAYILGTRVQAEGLLFVNSIQEHHIIKPTDINMDQILRYTIGIDMGKGTSKEKSKTIITCTGYTANKKTGIILGTDKLSATDPEELIKEIAGFINDLSAKNESFSHGKIEAIYIDDALSYIVNSVHNYFKRFNIKTGYCVKTPRESRVTLFDSLLYTDRVFFIDTPGNIELIKNLKKVTTDGKGAYIDANTEEIDFLDALMYTFTPYQKQLSNQYMKI